MSITLRDPDVSDSDKRLRPQPYKQCVNIVTSVRSTNRMVHSISMFCCENCGTLGTPALAGNPKGGAPIHRIFRLRRGTMPRFRGLGINVENQRLCLSAQHALEFVQALGSPSLLDSCSHLSRYDYMENRLRCHSSMLRTLLPNPAHPLGTVHTHW